MLSGLHPSRVSHTAQPSPVQADRAPCQAGELHPPPALLLLQDETVNRIAQKHSKAPAEVLVRWVLRGGGGAMHYGLAAQAQQAPPN